MTDRADTRHRLVEMRRQLVAALGCWIDGGGLALLADVQGALAAVDAQPDGGDVETADRAVVSDDGETIRLVMYREAEAVAVVLDPARAVRIAGELIEAAASRLG